MKTYTIEELDDIFREEDTYPYVALFSDTNKMMVHYPANTSVTKGKAGWERVRKRLLSKGLPDGFYIVKGKASPLKNVSPDVFYFKKGNVKEKELPPIQLAEPSKKSVDVLTYDAAIAANKDIANLTAEVSRLKMEIADRDKSIQVLEDDISEYEDDIAELSEKGGISDSKQYLEDLVTTAIPIADRYFDLQEKKLALRAQELNGGQRVLTPQQPQPQPQPSPPQPPKPTAQDAKKFWDEMGVLLRDDPEEYQRVMQKLQAEQGFEEVDNG